MHSAVLYVAIAFTVVFCSLAVGWYFVAIWYGRADLNQVKQAILKQDEAQRIMQSE